MVTMAENHAMNLSIIYHLTKEKSKNQPEIILRIFFQNKIEPINVLSAHYLYTIR